MTFVYCLVKGTIGSTSSVLTNGYSSSQLVALSVGKVSLFWPLLYLRILL